MSKPLQTVFIIALVTLVNGVLAAVDPYWLRSWELALESQPEEIKSVVKIVDESTKGQPFVIRGKVFEPDGKTAAANVLVHSYHRDHNGFEFGDDEKQYPAWQLQGWVKTDKDGKFEIQTIKPASDHMGREGAHIHFTVISKDYGKQWAPKVFLADDPITQKQRKTISGRNNIIAEIKQDSGFQSIEIEFSLKSSADF